MTRILMILFLSVNMVSLSQNPISFGVKGGVNFANLGGRDFVIEPSAIVGFHFGLLSEVAISDDLFVQGELLFSQNGAKFNSEFTITTGPSDPGMVVNTENTLKYTYINIPIFVQYRLSDEFSIGLGPQLGFNISAVGESESILGEIPSEEEDFSDITETFELGGGLNAQYELPIGLLLQARYVLGLTNIDASETQEGGFNEDPLLNRTFQVSVGYKF